MGTVTNRSQKLGMGQGPRDLTFENGGHMGQPLYHYVKLLSLSNALANWAVIIIIFFNY